ncbi:MAG: GFA family protein [Sphingomicrobium sp.]
MALPNRTASCRCGQLTATCAGEPVRVSVCHCLDCQQRSGSAFAVQARFAEEKVAIEGRSKSWTHSADSGNVITFHFCAECGSTVHYRIDGKFDGLVAIPVGPFADPRFPAPKFSVWEERRHDWVAILGDDVEHIH